MDITSEDQMVMQCERLSNALRTYGDGYGQLGRAFAAQAGLHSTDAMALIEILAAEQQGAPLSPARLGERVGLTSGATSTLLNRLEDAGHIVRSRVSTDRRVVTLHSTPEIHLFANSFFDPLGERIAVVMSRYPVDVLDQFVSLLGELHHVLETYRDDQDW